MRGNVYYNYTLANTALILLPSITTYNLEATDIIQKIPEIKSDTPLKTKWNDPIITRTAPTAPPSDSSSMAQKISTSLSATLSVPRSAFTHLTPMPSKKHLDILSTPQSKSGSALPDAYEKLLAFTGTPAPEFEALAPISTQNLQHLMWPKGILDEPIAEFTLFPNLPAELRLMIFRQALPEKECLLVVKTELYWFNPPSPGVLHTRNRFVVESVKTRGDGRWPTCFTSRSQRDLALSQTSKEPRSVFLMTFKHSMRAAGGAKNLVRFDDSIILGFDISIPSLSTELNLQPPAAFYAIRQLYSTFKSLMGFFGKQFSWSRKRLFHDLAALESWFPKLEVIWVEHRGTVGPDSLMAILMAFLQKFRERWNPVYRIPTFKSENKDGKIITLYAEDGCEALDQNLDPNLTKPMHSFDDDSSDDGSSDDE